MSKEIGSHYRFVRANMEKDASAISRIWQDNLEHPAPAEKFFWLYSATNPAGAGAAYLLMDDATNTAVGVSCLAHRQFYFGKDKKRAGILADFAVDVKHRSLKPALNLTQKTIRDSLESFDFLFGFPNRKAFPVIKRAECRQIGTLVRYVRVLDTGYQLTNKLPKPIAICTALFANYILRGIDFARRAVPSNYTAGTERIITDDFQLFYERALAQGLLIADRGRNALAWRHQLDPEAKENTLFVLRDKATQVRGYLVYRWDEDQVLRVIDFLAEDLKSLTALFLALFKQAHSLAVQSISVEYFGRQSVIDVLHSLLFYARESRPIFCAFADTATKAMRETNNWYLTSSDEDG